MRQAISKTRFNFEKY